MKINDPTYLRGEQYYAFVDAGNGRYERRAVRRAGMKLSRSSHPSSSSVGTNEFGFDTGVLKGKVRSQGKSAGLSSVVYLPTGLRLDSSLGLFSHYRVFTTNHRFGTAAWDWPSEASVESDGSLLVRWPSTITNQVARWLSICTKG